MATFLLTGGSGYIGSRLAARLLTDGHRVIHVVRPGSKKPTCANPDHMDCVVYDGDPAVLSACFQHEKIDGVFHLASMAVYGHAMADIAPMIASNVTFGTQLIEAMTGGGCTKLVNAGTYWQNFDGSPFDPICLYAATKQAQMDIIDYYVHWRGLSAVTLKLTDVYGPQDPRGKIFALLQKAARAQEPLPMTAGTQKVSFLHVDDAVDAFWTAMHSMGAGHAVYTIGNPAVPLRDAVATYLAQTGQKVDILWGAVAMRESQIMDPYLGAPMPGWRPRVTLEDGLRSLCACPEN